MDKTRNFKNNTSFAKDFGTEVGKRGHHKSLAGAVGLPDQKDWENICNMIAVYRKNSVRNYGFDVLVDCIANAKEEYHAQGRDYSGGKFNVVNKDSGMRYHFEFPESFVAWIQLSYPLMFTDKNHYHWFCKRFSDLRIAEKF